ncbi:hypothetical protein HHH56_28180 [Flammeovirga yaeyamensis]|nr:hypothetical protein [Flammeovirga yaeyamensis]
MSFTEKFNEEWEKLKDNRDKMPKLIMDFDVWRHFGETKGEIIKNKKTLFSKVFLSEKLILDIESFQQNILFKNYLENRIYASDYWL